MLNEMRLGRISDQTVKKFKALSRPLQFEDGLEVTELYERSPLPHIPAPRLIVLSPFF